MYADVLFLINFAINYMLLYITALCVKTTPRHFRIGVSAAIGGIYSVCMFLPGAAIITNLISKALLSVVMVYAAFGTQKYLRHLCFFYAVSFLCAGIVTAVSFKANLFLSSNGVVYINASPVTIILCAFFSYCLIRITYGIYKNYSLRDYVRMVVCKNGRAVHLTVLIDTGNSLCDPVGGGPVIVAEQNALKGIFGDEDAFAEIEKIHGVRLIPVKTVSSNDILVGFKPDKITCKMPLKEDTVIAVTTQKLGADYNALAGPHSFLGQ